VAAHESSYNAARGLLPALIYDEERDLFRFTEGRFAFSRVHADWELLKKRRSTKGL
jgi:hypothetical protein